MLTARSLVSPHFNERDPAVSLRYIVLHYTGMSAEDWIKAVRDPATKLSAHYLVDEEGNAFQIVGEARRAWHAGESFWRGLTDMNSASIGIELSNPGHEHGYRPFTPEQIAALKELARDIVCRHAMNPATAFLAHSDIAPARKQDPGELFPWRSLAEEGLGLWPEPRPEHYLPFNDDEIVTLLRGIGYFCPGDNRDDPDSRAALLAFQRRYHPENLAGAPDAETVARLRALKTLQEERALHRGG